MAKRVIALLGHPIQNEDGAANEAITPGMLITRNGSGLWIKHATAAAVPPCREYAMERDEMGNNIDVAYAIGDTVKAGAFSPGMRVNALIANGVNVGIGAKLESAGNGTLRAVTTGTAIAEALEAVNNTSGANARLRVQVL